MKRVCVLGCSGAGKTTLANEIARRTGLPHHSLDAHYWQPGWAPMPGEDWRRKHDELSCAAAWVIDGNYFSTLDRRLASADTVVFIDYPRWRCLLGVLIRTARWWDRSRPDMGPDCPERLDLESLRYVWNFGKDHRPRIVALLGDASHLRVIRIRDNHERAAFLASLAGN